MSEYAPGDGSPPQHGNETSLHNASLEDSYNAANNSIMGKVKSRVSSILPNRLSKWFSPSTKLQNDSLNGSLNCANTTQPARRRRRIEVEEEDNYDDEIQRGEYARQEDNTVDDEEEEENDDEESQNSEEQYFAYDSGSTKPTRRALIEERQPPAKKSRLNVNVRDSPLITRRQPLVSSTPAVANTYSHNSSSTTNEVAPRSTSYQRFRNLNLYAHQSKKEPGFNFGDQQRVVTTTTTTKINTDIIDLISNPPNEAEDKLAERNSYHGVHTGISSRRSLNIPSSSLTGAERVYATVAQLKRQPISTAKIELSASLSGAVPPRRTSTTIHEEEDFVEQQYGEETVELTETNANNYNGRRVEETNNYATNKRLKLINGTSNPNATENPDINEAIVIDSASESGESTTDVNKANPSNIQQQQQKRKTGPFNMSAIGTGGGNTRNGSRTSSFGNGLNFYSHLEGRKSLFSGNNHGISNPLNNSTLSLTSLNRRQFNASIYGSTSALSDSRLLNTFSPFYKGKTTYGGAAAYNKYTAGAGASAVRITPTLIRPTSSLSTLSSSNNSLATNTNTQQVGDNSTISSTAKRILDLINDFATPLSEAKKMASNLKTNPHLQLTAQTKGRLNESDLNASRTMRLSQVRTPYARPAVILQPSGNANGRGMMGGPLPPVRELQVPTMSQLLQMKKIQKTTERARRITTQNIRNNEANVGLAEYTLPGAANKATDSVAEQEPHQKHTSKIKNKVLNTSRPSAASKAMQDDEPPPPVNLPNIAFPLMQSVPKIDIQLSRTTASNSIPTNQTSTTTKTAVSNKTEATKSTTFAFNTKPLTSTPTSTQATATTTPKTDFKTMQTLNNSTSTAAAFKTTNDFKFSEPLQVKGVTTSTQNNTAYMNNYKFSPPLDVTTSFSLSESQNTTQPQKPQLKAGSCLDALSKPFTMPTTSKTNTALSPLSSGFGNQFKKSSNEWECDACMIRNKAELNKCLACETPRKQTTTQQTTSISSQMTPLASTFGDQFKKSSAEWECDTCMIRNKAESAKCVACETPRVRATASGSTTSLLPPIKNTFGDAFKPKSGTWECQTCMITNKTDVNECVACQTKKPGASNVTNSSSVAPAAASQFKFGFASAAATNTNSSSSDAGFKTLAAQQKASKWECDACMTRNDANRTKCACCEQPKPGTTSMESSSSSENKFTFGATAAAKFSFGFGPSANAPKEEDLKKELSNKTDDKKPALGLTNTSSSIPPAGFQFGIKPSTTTESKKDETDGKVALAGIKFGFSADTAKKSETPLTTTTTAATGLLFGSKSLTTTASTTAAMSSSTATASIVNSPSVKFNLPTIATTTSSNDKPTGVAAPTFSFGTNNAASSTTGGFAFGNKSAAATKDVFGFETPADVSTTTAQSSGFVFGSPAAIKNTTTAVSSSNTTTTTASSATTVAIKPMFSFGSSATSSPTTGTSAAVPPTAAVAPLNTPAFGGFSFGGTSTTNTPTPTTGNIFGAVTSTSTTSTTTANATPLSTTTTKPASANIFGSFGGADGGGGGGGGSTTTNTPTATPTFGSSPNTPANNSTTVSSSTNSSTNKIPQFGTFGAKIPTSNIFGSFGGNNSGGGNGINKTTETKPTLPMFGNVASSSTTQPSSNSSTFVFGSSNALNTTPASSSVTASAGSATATGSVTSTSATWPKNSFVFGISAPQTTSTTLAAPSANDFKEGAKPSVFGTFATPSTNSANQQQVTSIFGAPTASNATAASPPAFGSVSAGSSNSSSNLFGTNSAPAATNVFGANSSGTAATPAPAFGSSPFGGSASSTSATPTFGSTAAAGSITTFGGFGAAANASNATTNVAAQVKKPEAAFNFGAAPATQSTSGGFNFGSSSSTTTKPAFNFGGTATSQQPTFNFTGSAESQNSTKPFQFGATPSAPVYDFSRGALEGTPNAPFQFNAGAAPVTSNIFAPTPTPGAQTAQQAKRKIRAPIRRVTQR